ncbi:MAG: SH3 domain-containing protein [Proteobacteria bacterium]|nr:SH3 domain-containing protein [Pseudomonadota bacterium]
MENNIKQTTLRNILVTAMAVVIVSGSGTVDAQIFGMKKGKGGSEVQGSAGPGGATGADGLEKCATPMGAMAVIEPQSHVVAALSRYNLTSPTGIIRMMIQQSNCFIVVERGQGMANMQQERALLDSGELRGGSNMGGGQMVAADFVLTPAVVFSDGNAGGVGGAIGGAVGGLFGGAGRTIGALAGGVKFKEAQTSMLVSDTRSGVQVAAAEGSAKKADLALGGFIGFAGGGGYASTSEGKIIAASLVDNYNNIVISVRGQTSLHRNVGTLQQEAAAGGQQSSGAAYNAGDSLFPKINNLKLYSGPGASNSVISQLPKTEEMVYMGEETDGFLLIESGQGGGWVQKILIQK